MSTMLFPNVLFKSKETRSNEELAEHFEKMKANQELRKKNTIDEVSRLSEHELLELRATVNDTPTSISETMLLEIVNNELEKRSAIIIKNLFLD